MPSRRTPAAPLLALLVLATGCGAENSISDRIADDSSTPTAAGYASSSDQPRAQPTTDQVVLGSDEGAFAIRGEMTIVDGDDFDSTLLGTDGDWGGDVVVLTGSQFGPFEIRTRVLPEASPAATRWEDVDELTLEVGAGGVVATELVNNDPTVSFIDEAGTYRVRVSARGRVSDDERARNGLLDESDDETPVEHYLLEAWPADPAPPEVRRETSAYAAEVRRGPEPEPVIAGQRAGLAGAARIGRDADDRPGARTLSGGRGSITVSRTYATRADDLYDYLRFGPTLSQHVPSWSFMAGAAVEDVGLPGYSAASDDHPDQLSGSTGLIRTTMTAEDVPRRRVQQWAWMVPGADGSQRIEDLVVLSDTRVATTYVESTGPDGGPRTVVTVRHDDVPVEWVDDLRAWWDYQLAFVEWYAERY